MINIAVGSSHRIAHMGIIFLILRGNKATIFCSIREPDLCDYSTTGIEHYRDDKLPRQAKPDLVNNCKVPTLFTVETCEDHCAFVRGF